jgi:hypothetical protein
MQGIPGSGMYSCCRQAQINAKKLAGKTFLTAGIVDQARSRNPTIAVFGSHIYQSSTTALPVLQSLIFQAVSDNKDLRTVLVESKERELMSNTVYAATLFKALL